MWLTIDLHSETPIYTQIRNQIIEGILINGLKGGESLPSVRQLASDLGVNLHTVNKAYTILKQDGFIQIHRQKGAVVNPLTSYKASEAYFQRLYTDAKPLVIESMCRGVTKDEFLKFCNGIYDNLENSRGGK